MKNAPSTTANRERKLIQKLNDHNNAEAEFVSAPAQQLPSLAKTYAALKPATAFTSRYSSRPYLPHSRPLPDCL